MIKLSDRLKSILSFIRQSGGFLDIGSDHALIPMALKERGFLGKIYASEVTEGPFLRMKKAIIESGYDITPLLGDGLSICPSDVDQILISGMGGITIVKILVQGASALKKVRHLVLEPQSNADLVLRKMNELGFKEIGGAYVKEKNKVYPVLIYEQGSETRDELEMNYSSYALNHGDSVLMDYLTNEKIYLEKIPKTISAADLSRIEAKLELLDEALKRLRSSF